MRENETQKLLWSLSLTCMKIWSASGRALFDDLRERLYCKKKLKQELPCACLFIVYFTSVWIWSLIWYSNGNQIKVFTFLCITGPVCTVAVSGPLRKGKSYILSEAFDQPEVFPLGHEFDPETMGIWIWIVPEKYKVWNLDFGNLFHISHSNISNY